MIIEYMVFGITEDNEFSYAMDKINGNYYCALNMPFMINDDSLIESPSAKPYDIPLPVGIKKCNVDVVMFKVKNISIISSENFVIPCRRITKVPKVINRDMGIIEIPSNGMYNVTNAVISSSGETSYLIATGTYINEYSGELKFPIKYGKSPKSLFRVDGSGNTIKADLISTSTRLPTTALFSIVLSDIEYGGVPSADY